MDDLKLISTRVFVQKHDKEEEKDAETIGLYFENPTWTQERYRLMDIITHIVRNRMKHKITHVKKMGLNYYVYTTIPASFVQRSFCDGFVFRH